MCFASEMEDGFWIKNKKNWIAMKSKGERDITAMELLFVYSY